VVKRVRAPPSMGASLSRTENSPSEPFISLVFLVFIFFLILPPCEGVVRVAFVDAHDDKTLFIFAVPFSQDPLTVPPLQCSGNLSSALCSSVILSQRPQTLPDMFECLAPLSSLFFRDRVRASFFTSPPLSSPHCSGSLNVAKSAHRTSVLQPDIPDWLPLETPSFFPWDPLEPIKKAHFVPEGLFPTFLSGLSQFPSFNLFTPFFLSYLLVTICWTGSVPLRHRLL